MAGSKMPSTRHGKTGAVPEPATPEPATPELATPEQATPELATMAMVLFDLGTTGFVTRCRGKVSERCA